MEMDAARLAKYKVDSLVHLNTSIPHIHIHIATIRAQLQSVWFGQGKWKDQMH